MIFSIGNVVHFLFNSLSFPHWVVHILLLNMGIPLDHIHKNLFLMPLLYATGLWTLRFLPQLEMRPSSNAPNPVESREAPPTSSFPGFSEPP